MSIRATFTKVTLISVSSIGLSLTPPAVGCLPVGQTSRAAIYAGITPHSLLEVSATANQAAAVLSAINESEETIAAFQSAESALAAAAASRKQALAAWRRNPRSSQARAALATATQSHRTALTNFATATAAVRQVGLAVLNGEQSAAMPACATSVNAQTALTQIRARQALPAQAEEPPQGLGQMIAVFQ
jgi:hypothetical protein